MAEQRLPPSAPVDPEWVEAQLSRLDLLLRALVEPEALGRLLLDEVAPLVGAAGGAVYTAAAGGEGARVDSSSPAGAGALAQLTLSATHGNYRSAPARVTPGEGFVGACAVERRPLFVRDVPAEHFRVRAADGSARLSHCVVVPVWAGEGSLAVLELAFSQEPSPSALALLDRLSERRALGQAVSHSASTPESVARMRPSHRYGFWGKLSHELRSPLNSVLVLSQLLSENAEANLSPKQIAFAKAIHASGSDLLALVNAISDLSKIETNRLVLEPIEMSFEHFRAHLQRAFDPVASERGLEFSIELAPGLPAVIVTDAKRVRQILKCLLSNAFKFTESGRVSVSVALAKEGWSSNHERLNNVRDVVAFAVSDTGVGLSESEQRSILEVFPPERIEARRGPGASGLGLAISRELARLLGGDLRVTSAVGAGSTFTLYLPVSGAQLDATPAESDAEAVAREELGPAPLGLPRAGEVRGPKASPSSGTDAEGVDTSARDGADGGGVEPADDAAAVPTRPPSSPARSRQSGDAPAPPELAGLDVMLVDDDVRSAFALTGILERQGVSVSHAEGVSEALQRMAEGRRVSAFLIDADLLVTGSEELVRRLVSRWAHLPIVALTRSASEEPSNGAVRARRHALPPEVHVLERPVEPAALAKVLGTVAARAKKHY